ncbi:competence type IV pilus minor pilin ComGD [Oceanobacillus sp. Castelsardo]|uniref:competence type IV pilus minor pilin ComGD n=1 Tax=Oceanobacillus sp. Castelsardo TaxID=1851204 RepID=UPI0008380D4E|nr:competence type IV pilus minor pilin ComGD [Oceanobacillus sp. Castelsardo]
MIKNGFTLIELLFVLAIVSIIILISPTLKGASLKNIQDQQFLTVLQSDVLYLQNLSTTTEDNVRITFSNNSYTLKKGEADILNRYYPDGITVNTRENNNIKFKVSGTIVNRKTIVIKTNQSTYHLVFPLGKGRMNIVEV